MTYLVSILVTAIYGLLLGGTFVLCARRQRAWTHPIMLVTAWEFLFIFLDALFTILAGSYGPSEFDRYLLDPNSFSKALAGWILLHLTMLIFFEILNTRSGFESPDFLPPSLPRNADKPGRLTMNYVLLLALLISLGATLLVVASQPGNLYDIWANRNLIFSDGGGVLLTGGQIFRYALILWLAVRWRDKVRVHGAVVLALVLVDLALELAVNSRSGIVFGFILPLVLVYNRYASRISIKRVVILSLVIFLLFGVAFRTVARDQFFSANQGFSIAQVLVENVSELPRFFWGGFEASSLDGSIDIIDKYQRTRLSEGTLLNALSAPVPRPLWPDKPRGGASSVYTETNYPNFYGTIRAEYSASFTGELYMNLGFAGTVFGGALLGIWLYALKKLYDNQLPLVLIVYGIAIGRTFSLLRGDSFNFVAQLSSSLLALLLVAIVYWSLRSFLFTFVYQRRAFPARLQTGHGTSHRPAIPSSSPGTQEFRASPRDRTAGPAEKNDPQSSTT